MKPFRILIVDDNPQLHEALILTFSPKADDYATKLSQLYEGISQSGHESLLNLRRPNVHRKNFEIHSAYSGEEACELIRTGMKEGQPYSVAIVDVRMPPGIDGVETTLKLWEIDASLQVIICTAYSDRAWEELYHRLNPTDNLLILKKPFDIAEITQMVYSLAEKWRTTRRSRDAMRVLDENNRALEQIVNTQQQKIIESNKLAELGKMFSELTHEINTPLTVIKMRSRQVIRDVEEKKIDNTKLLEQLRSIETNGNRIASIVSGILLMSRNETDDGFMSASLLDILITTLSLCEEKLQLHSVKLILNIPQNFTIFCNPTKISQVLLNLFSNAIDSLVRYETRWIDITAEEDEQEARIYFTDSGARIEDTLITRIMQPFFTTKPYGKGTGLGLSISQNILTDHGGQLEIDRQHAHMRFILRLPHPQED